MCKNTKQFKARIAGLESQVDILESELVRLHEMLTCCGFPEGIKTLKETMNELMEEQAASQ